ncbi:hypothetical protein OROHE_026264 [Orobanche hederae]
MAATVDSYRQQNKILATLAAQSPVLAALIAASTVLPPYPEFFNPVITCNTTRPIRSSPITAPPPSRVRPETNQTHSNKTPSSLADVAPRSDHRFPFPEYREDDAHRRPAAYSAAFTTRFSMSIRLVTDGEEEHSRTALPLCEEDDTASDEFAFSATALISPIWPFSYVKNVGSSLVPKEGDSRPAAINILVTDGPRCNMKDIEVGSKLKVQIGLIEESPHAYRLKILDYVCIADVFDVKDREELINFIFPGDERVVDSIILLEIRFIQIRGQIFSKRERMMKIRLYLYYCLYFIV